MNRKVVALLTFQLGLLSAVPLSAQDAVLGADFWVGLGRFGMRDVSEVLDPPDLSGIYQVEGKNPGDSGGTYQTTLRLKRTKTVQTPQGRKINWYEVRYEFSEPVEGLAVHIGRRLYLAYGSKNIALVVGAPLILTPDEAAVAERARTVQLQAAQANQNYDDNTTYFSKGAPWFSALKIKGQDHFHISSDSPWSSSGFYALWFNARDDYGQQVFPWLAPWNAGEFKYIDYDLKKGNEGTNWEVGSFTIARDQETFQLEETVGSGPNKGTVNGTAHQLDDGTVVWVIGGGQTAGAAFYDFVNGTLAGRWWAWGTSLRGTETLTPAPEIAAAHAELFGSR